MTTSYYRNSHGILLMFDLSFQYSFDSLLDKLDEIGIFNLI